MVDTELLIRTALECGADKAVIIEEKDIVTDPSFREMCAANRCRTYGKCYMCPPDCGEVDELTARLRSYPNALFYQKVTNLDDHFDFEGMIRARREFGKLSQKMMTACGPLVGPDALHLSVGGCGVCDVCAKVTGEPCRFPDRAISSLEAYVINVAGTCKNTELKYINGQDTVTYFGMILYDSENRQESSTD